MAELVDVVVVESAEGVVATAGGDVDADLESVVGVGLGLGRCDGSRGIDVGARADALPEGDGAA